MENLEGIEEKFQNGNVLFENQNYSQAINNYKEIKEKYSDQLSENSKMQLELAILKTHMKLYHQNISTYPDDLLDELKNEINKSFENLHKVELEEDNELYYLEIEFNILLEKYNVALELLEKDKEIIGEIPDILLFYIKIFNKKNELSKCQQYFDKLDSLIVTRLTESKIRYILENEFGLSSEKIHQKILQKNEEVGLGHLTDEGALQLIAEDYEISKNQNITDYEEFVKNNREEIIEQKSIFFIKQGISGKILEELIAIDMIQNEKYLEYNWALTKACIDFGHNLVALSLTKWLLEKNFFNSQYHELLIDTLQMGKPISSVGKTKQKTKTGSTLEVFNPTNNYEIKTEESTSQKVVDKVKFSQISKERIDFAKEKLEVQITKLSGINEKLQAKHDKIFEKCVNAQRNNKPVYAQAYAGELAQVRKMKNMVSGAKLSMEQVKFKLDTVSESDDVKVTLSPCMSIIKGLSPSLSGIMPGANASMQDLSQILDDVICDPYSQNRGAENKTENKKEVLDILEEVHDEIRGKNKKNKQFHEVWRNQINDIERSILISTAKKWRQNFSNDDQSTKFDENYDSGTLTDDKQLTSFLHDHQISLEKILVNLVFFDEITGPQFAGNCVYGTKSTLFEDSIYKKINEMEKKWFEELESEYFSDSEYEKYQERQITEDDEQRQIEEEEWFQDNDMSMDVDYSMNDDSFDTESFEKD